MRSTTFLNVLILMRSTTFLNVAECERPVYTAAVQVEVCQDELVTQLFPSVTLRLPRCRAVGFGCRRRGLSALCVLHRGVVCKADSPLDLLLWLLVSVSVVFSSVVMVTTNAGSWTADGLSQGSAGGRT